MQRSLLLYSEEEPLKNFENSSDMIRFMNWNNKSMRVQHTNSHERATV